MFSRLNLFVASLLTVSFSTGTLCNTLNSYPGNFTANNGDTMIRGKIAHSIPQNPLTIIPCSSAGVFCTGTTYTFPSGNNGTAPIPVGGYPNYGCCALTVGPAWYYMQVGVAGDIIITITQTRPPPLNNQLLDVDFVCWGPFTSVSDGCATGLTAANIADCSFSPSAIETCHIHNAQVGHIYILLMTNFSMQQGVISFSQTGGNGQTNCNPVIFCSMVALTSNPSVCSPTTNTFSVSGNLDFTNPPATGTLTITDNTAVPAVSQTFNPPFISPKAYSLANIPCDGLTHSIIAVFSDSTACTLTQQVSAPPGTCPSAVISGGGTICNDGVSHATVSVNISGSVAPYTFTYAVNGVNQAPVSNYSGPSPYIISTANPGTYTLVSVINQVCPAGGTVSGIATVSVNPLPAATINGTTTVCQNSTPPLIIFTGSSASPPYTFTYNINGGLNQQVTTVSGNSVTVAANVTTPGIYTYYLQNVQDGSSTACSQPQSGSAAVTVLPAPWVNLTSCNDPATTNTSRPFALKGGVPPGGQYLADGTVLSSGLLDPSSLAAGIHQITYRYTGYNSCTSTSATVTITVSTGSSSVSCPPNFNDPRDNQSYKAFKMGTYCWMLTNLNYGTKLNFNSQPQSDNCLPEKYCLATDASCMTYGGLYQWEELMQYQTPGPGQAVQGLCPPEWHIPSQSEWQDLIRAVTAEIPGDGIAGGYLKDSIPTFGFHALADGIFYQNYIWAFTSGSPGVTMFWTGTTSGPFRAVARGINTFNYSISFYPSLRSNAFPLRCVKD